jgi:hypothetical protein
VEENFRKWSVFTCWYEYANKWSIAEFLTLFSRNINVNKCEKNMCWIHKKVQKHLWRKISENDPAYQFLQITTPVSLYLKVYFLQFLLWKWSVILRMTEITNQNIDNSNILPKLLVTDVKQIPDIQTYQNWIKELNCFKVLYSVYSYMLVWVCKYIIDCRIFDTVFTERQCE